MSDPFRLQVQKAICDLFETITPANGFTNDLSAFIDEHGRPSKRVFRGRDDFGDNDPLPMVSVLEDPRAFDPNNAGEEEVATKGKYRLLIQGFVPDDVQNPTDPAFFLSADLVKALSATKQDKFNILGLGEQMPCVTGIEIGQPVHRPADNEVSSVAFCFLTIVLSLVEDLERP